MKSKGDQLLDAYVAAGCPVNHGRRGWVGLAYIATLILLAVLVIYFVFYKAIPILWHIPPVSTPVAEWTEIP